MSTLDQNQLDLLVSRVLAAPKYAQVCEDVVRRIGARELANRASLKDAEHATRNKLHQIGGAYLGEMRYARWLAELREASANGATRECLARIMRHHASARERLPMLEQIYAQIFSRVPAPSSILDVACGLNPLSIPWMGLAPGTKYIACDIYADMMAFLAQAMPLLDVNAECLVTDVIGQPPPVEVDLAFVLKTIPCLEQVDADAGLRLLGGLRAKHIVVSFPAKTLGGRNVGMAANYTRRLNDLVARLPLEITSEFEVSTEIVFVLSKLDGRRKTEDGN
ncbi:MAG TPA: hypothetical protein PL074_05015 [Thermoflexales bacterium]|nr:hypothetical protein [Thermoflexales bacterium]